MEMNCNVIRDLLPLYADQICSEESRELVDGHLAQCGDCSEILRQMRSTELESGLKSETEDVLRRQAGFFKRRSALAGAVIAGIFMIPVLVCLIVNLACGAALDWFFIVLASLVTAASLIVVPLMMPENRLLWTMGTFTASLLLLLGVICIYTKGTWFFVVASSVLFGFSLSLLPVAVCTRPLKTVLGGQKGLTVMAVATVFFGLMMLSIGLFVRSGEYCRIASAVSLPVLIFIWILFLIIRYVKMRGQLKGGICTVLVGIFGFFADHFINRCIGIEKPLPVFRPFTWRADTINDNVYWLLLLGCILAGVPLIFMGIVKKGKR